MKSPLVRRWSLLLIFLTLAAPALSASAPTTVTIRPGDSLDSLARRFHVAKRDIARLNGIDLEAILADGRTLRIPAPPKAVVKPASMHRDARVRGNRIAVRIGPDEDHRRLTLLDDGAPLVVTSRSSDWLQAQLPGGGSGWIRADFVAIGGRSVAVSPSHPRAPVKSARLQPDKRAAGARVAASPARTARRSARKRMSAGNHTARRQASAAAGARAAHRLALERQRRSSGRQGTRQAALTRARERAGSVSGGAGGSVVRTAFAYRGVPYRFGGSSRGGFDCSGFTSHVYSRQGVQLPHSASSQFSHGRAVPRGDLHQGDLVFFHTTRAGISHVGIYIGADRFVHASSSGGSVRVDSLSSSYYSHRFRGARRLK